MSLKIISGKWKKTNLLVKNFKYLKPTNMFIKKKLFNWLSKFFILNKVCLDLFSGSGSLGIESASRGARKVYFVENNKKIFNYLLSLKKFLNADNFFMFNMCAYSYLKKFGFKKVDLVFIDSPYKEYSSLINFIKFCLQFFSNGVIVYIESVLNINLIYNYFYKYLKIEKFGFYNKIYFFLFSVI